MKYPYRVTYSVIEEVSEGQSKLYNSIASKIAMKSFTKKL